MQGGISAGMGGFADLNNPNARPKVRNPIMTCALPWAIMIAGSILGSVLGMIFGPLAYIGTLLQLAGYGLFLFSGWSMAKELKNTTNDPGFNPVFALIPCLNIYALAFLVPAQVTKAKQMARSQQPTRGFIVYLLLPLYALAADLNDLAGAQK